MGVLRCLLLALSAALAGCASVTTGTTQDIMVRTIPVDGATCQLSNEKGSWTVPQTPGKATVSKAFGSLAVACKLEAGGDGASSTHSTLAPTFFGNVLVGGLLGMVIDMSTGAAADYPSEIKVALSGVEPVQPAAPEPEPVVPNDVPPPPERAGKARKSGPATAEDRQIEITYWNSVKDSKNPAAFQSYLQQFPSGAFVPLARLKLAELGSGRDAKTANAAAPARRPVTTYPDSVQLRCPAEGTVIEFTDGSKRHFVRGDAMRCAYRLAPEGELLQASPLGDIVTPANEEEVQRLWPLKVGNEAVKEKHTGASNYYEKFTVLRHEKINTKAGQFDAFLIEWVGSGSDAGRGSRATRFRETASFWYAPEIGYTVKATHKIEQGVYGRANDAEAVKISLPQ